MHSRGFESGSHWLTFFELHIIGRSMRDKGDNRQTTIDHHPDKRVTGDYARDASAYMIVRTGYGQSIY